MLKRSAIFQLLVGGVIMAPLLAFGHACEFLVARMDIHGDQLKLEITADYGGNPMIADADAARTAIREILSVRLKGKDQSLEALAPLRFESRTQWDPATPASFAPPPDGQQHELLTGIWQWRATTNEVALAVPRGCHNDVLLWTTASHLPGKQVQWMLLIEGDSTPTIAIATPHSGSGFGQWWHWAALGIFPALFVAYFVRHKPTPARLP